MKTKVLIIPVVIAIIVFSSSVYVVDEREQVVITQFGKAVGRPITEPGLKFKVPIIQKANFFPKQLLEWDGDPGQIPTLDKTFIFVDTFARWKIVDPLKFFETVTNVGGALARLDDILDSAVRNFITSYPLIETVRKSNRKLEFEIGASDMEKKGLLGKVTTGREKIVRGILNEAQPKLEKFGIQLVDVKIKRLNYVEEVQRSVYGRMIAERKQIAEKFRSEGQGEARKIEGEMEKELKRITSGAYRKAQEIKGKADAEAAMIYAQAFGKDPEFYSFLQTLKIYKEAMNKDSSMIMTTNSEFLKYFKGYQEKEQ
ncbi:MAG: protease modulator HflC [Deltaproteobacteria bacterium]|nr:protease modulator HflC [Deltaproteobacteria bacterium]MBW2018073.1 protease modulator HflC [Deltaproteobacteria bacterium]MBW2130727.1 protease modulator HflC [Deltaproteobacteria bacterium]MBW2303692.1 protease modulator HflC [Deltaproteobacteria bacterium]